MITEEQWDKMLLTLVPVVTGITSIALGLLALTRSSPLGHRAYHLDGQYLVSVRYPGHLNDIREFVQPHNPDVIAVYSQYGPDPWALFDFVCKNTEYVADFGEYWRFPSETLRGFGDCEDTSILLTSLIRAGGAPCYVALGSLGGYGHSWCQLDGQILETTYTAARLVPDPQSYCPYVLFDNE
ncbi:unnamed protein product, partial [marine sediment metagenome]